MLKNYLASFFVVCFMYAPIAFAAPSAPSYIINDTTKQCSDFFWGDEFFSCEPPSAEWREIDPPFVCPTGYTAIEAETNCTASDWYYQTTGQPNPQSATSDGVFAIPSALETEEDPAKNYHWIVFGLFVTVLILAILFTLFKHVRNR